MTIEINSPGRIETKGHFPEHEEAAKKIPIGRTGQSEDIAKGIVFLASTDASFITGVNLVIDGGQKFVFSATFGQNQQ